MSESNLVNSFNKTLKRLKKGGKCYRLKQSRFSDQFLDIILDSAHHGYFAIEHKSITKKDSIYFSSNFKKHKDGSHQVETINEFINDTGRKGFLFVEIRRGAGKPLELYAIPWSNVWRAWKKKQKGLKHIPEFGYKINRKGDTWLLKKFINKYGDDRNGRNN